MGKFERYLSYWVGISIFLGIVLGYVLPDFFALISTLEFAHVNFPVAILIWFMIFPMMLQIDFASIKDVGKKPKGLILTVSINWLVKPFTMALLGWFFFHYVFQSWVKPEDASEYIAGMILLGVAPCTAMVFVWSQLTKGDPNYTLVQVSVNDIIMIFAFAPIAAFLLGATQITVPWNTLILSVILYVLIPLIAGIVVRKILQNKVDRLVAKLKPISAVSLLAMVSLLFGFQAESIISKPHIIVLIAIPLLLQSYSIFMLTFALAHALKLPFNVAAPAALIGTSNFFELAVAVAISTFGLHSGAALATVVGVLIEVPVMLHLVKIANETRFWFEE